MAILTLSTSGPTPTPLTLAAGDRSLTIENELGSEVTLSLNPAGFLNPSNAGLLTVPTDGKTVTVGASGTYEYSEPGSKARGTRSGRINVG